MTTTLSEITTVADVTKYLRTLPAMREQEERAAAELAAKRADLVEQLAEVKSRRNGTGVDGKTDSRSELARLRKECDAATVAREKARQALEAAYERERVTSTAITQHTMACDHEKAKLEGELRATADPRIGAFIEWCHNAFDTVRHRGFIPDVASDQRDSVTGNKVEIRAGNGAECEVVLAALRAAIDAADALRLATPADATEGLRAIAATIPSDVLMPGRVMDRATLTKVLSDDPDGPSWMARVLGAGSGR